MDILQQLYHGKLYPEEKFTPNTEEYHLACKEHSQHYDAFRQQLNSLDPDLCEQFDILIEEQSHINSLENFHMFKESFKLGIRLISNHQ